MLLFTRATKEGKNQSNSCNVLELIAKPLCKQPGKMIAIMFHCFSHGLLVANLLLSLVPSMHILKKKIGDTNRILFLWVLL